jgi:hypothetical protein
MRQATLQSDWRGVRHARITGSMLPGDTMTSAQSAVLNHLSFLIPYGTSAHVSNALLAQRTGYTEGYVSVLMRQLAGETVTSGGRTFGGMAVPRIVRTWTDVGYLIAVVPPTELTRSSFFAHQGDQPVDPPSHAPYHRTACREPAQHGDQQVDPPLHIEQEHDQNQQQPAVDSELLQELAGDDPQVVIEVLRINPALTKADLDRAVASADRPGVRNPRGLALHCLRHGLAITPARRGEPRPDRQRSRAVPWDPPEALAAHYAAATADQRAANAGDATPPADATPEELATWQTYTAHGDYTPVEALNLLLMARYHDQRQALVTQQEARYAQR